MTVQYFSGQIRGLRGPGLTAGEQAQITGIAGRLDTADMLIKRLTVGAFDDRIDPIRAADVAAYGARGTITRAFTTTDGLWDQPSYVLKPGYYVDWDDAGEHAFAGLSYLRYEIDPADTGFRASAVVGSNLTALAVWTDEADVYLGHSNRGTGAAVPYLDFPLTPPAGAAFVYITGESDPNNVPRLEVYRAKAVPLLRYNSDQFGGRFLDYSTRTNLFAAQILDNPANRTIEGSLLLGRSWATDILEMPATLRNMGLGDGRALAFSRASDSDVLPPMADEGIAAEAGDFENLSFDTVTEFVGAVGGGNFGFLEAQFLAMFRDRYKAQNPNNVVISGAYPGQELSALIPGGVTTDGKHPWASMLISAQKARDFADMHGCDLRVRSASLLIGLEEGSFIEPLEDYLAYIDAENFNRDGSLIHLNIDSAAPVASLDGVPIAATDAPQSVFDQWTFANENPTRVAHIGGRYAEPFRDYIHMRVEGIIQHAMRSAYIKHLVLDRGIQWGGGFRIEDWSFVSGQLHIALSWPGAMTAAAIDTAYVEAAPQLGFHLYQPGGAEVALSGFAIAPGSAANTALVTATPVTSSGAGTWTLGYADKGPGALFGTHSGAWGNIVLRGPKSLIDPAKTVDVWLPPMRVAKVIA